MAFEYSKEEWMRHAKTELDIVDEQPIYKEFYLKVLDVFTEFSHNQDTIYFTPEILEKLMRHDNLKPLTAHPAEWEEVGPEIWRNKRNPRAYSNDAGKTVIMTPRKDENYENNTIIPTNLPPHIEETMKSLRDVKNF